MADPKAMKRMWRTLSPRFRTASTAVPAAARTVPPAVPGAVVVFSGAVCSAVLAAVGACCMRIPSRHWEGDRHPADHFRGLRDESHGGLVSFISDCSAHVRFFPSSVNGQLRPRCGVRTDAYGPLLCHQRMSVPPAMLWVWKSRRSWRRRRRSGLPSLRWLPCSAAVLTTWAPPAVIRFGTGRMRAWTEWLCSPGWKPESLP
ncbi:hypothetical protein D9M72_436760 [compost metagenome]